MPKKVSEDLTDDSPKKVTRKRAVKTVAKTEDETILPKPTRTRTATRKAPTRIVEVGVGPTPSRRGLKIFAVLFLVLGASVWIGVSDSGQIDVSARINERNQKVSNGESVPSSDGSVSQEVVLPVQNTAPTVPNAGLRGRGIGTAPVVVPQVEEISSSSSEVSTDEQNDSATTTSESVSDGVADVSDEEGEGVVE